MRPIWLLSCFIIIATNIVACAGYTPPPELIGQPRESVTRTLGSPEREYATGEKTTLHFPRGPYGKHTYFVYLDNNDRVAGWEQVLNEESFRQVKPGMDQEQVIQLIGISKITNGLARQRGYVWHYRYFNHQCKSFVIEFSIEKIVRSVGYITRGGRRCNHVGPG